MDILTLADFRADLEVTLELARERCASVPEYEVYQRILMELEAMHEWMADGRNPTVEERQRIDIGLVAVREFDPPADAAMEEFCQHLHGLNYAFAYWPLLLTEPPQKLVPALAKGAEIGAVRLSPDGARLTFWCADADPPGIYAVKADALSTGKCLVPSDGWTASEIRWSPDGQSVAFTASSGPPPGELKIGFVSAEGTGVPKWLDGMSFAWGPRGSTLFTSDVPNQIVWCHDVSSGKKEALGWMEDDGDPHFPPRIVPSPYGGRVAVTTRSVQGNFTRVWVFEGSGKHASIRLLTEVPGASSHVLPFWPPDGKETGLRIIDLERQESRIVVLKGLQGQPDFVHGHDLVDEAAPALWLPGGQWMAFLKTLKPAHEFTKAGPQSLALVSPSGADYYEPPGLGVLEGEPRPWGESGIVIDGRGSATILKFAGPLSKRRVPRHYEETGPLDEV